MYKPTQKSYTYSTISPYYFHSEGFVLKPHESFLLIGQQEYLTLIKPIKIVLRKLFAVNALYATFKV